MPAPIDITGQRFGRLRVSGKFGLSRRGEYLWECQCDCGTIKIIGGYDLRSGHSSTCGCGTVDAVKRRSTKHGRTRSPEWRSWYQMWRRCTDEKTINYPRYGGIGVRVCHRWSEFDAFLEDMGEKPTPKHSIDRINPSGNYEPGNCRWATSSQQNKNKRPQA